MRAQTNKLLSLLLALVMIFSCVTPVLAEDGGETYADGTYSIGGSGYSTNMIAPDEEDFPSYVVVKDGEGWLVTRSYAPNKYDAVWKGKRSEAPEDPATANVIEGVFIKDEDGKYAESGTYAANVYDGNKAVQFVIPLTAAELQDGNVYFVLRRATWSASSPGQWMGKNDQYFNFGSLTKTSDDTTLPGGSTEPEEPITETFGFTLQVGQYTEGADFHTASFEGVTYALTDTDGKVWAPSNATTGMLTYSKLDAAKTYVFTATKEGWTVVYQGEWNTEAHAYEYIFTGEDEIRVTITKDDDGKNISDHTNSGMIFRKKPREENDVDRALALVPADLSIFTQETAAAVEAAVAAADPTVEDAETLAAMAEAVIDAIRGLIPQDGSYRAAFEHTGNGMFKIIDVISLEVKNGEMSLRFVNGSQTYIKLYLGTTDEANAADESEHILPGEAATASNGKKGYHWEVPVAALQTEIPVAAYSKSKQTFNSTGNFLVKANSLTPTLSDGRIDLTISNKTGMFKAATAYVETLDARSSLVVALTGTTYENLFRGTYEQAVANGDNRDNWIHYTTNADGKYEFVFPLADGETYIPVVSISKTYLAKYEAGENPLERAFYPRQFVLDLEAGTLTVGDYDETITAAVKSNAEAFKVAETATMRVVGGPNSNNYNVAPTLQMLDDTYDQVTYPTVVDGKVSTATAELTADKTFAISLLNAPTKEAFRDKEPISMQFRVKATGAMVTYRVTIDLLAKTITIDGVTTGWVQEDGNWHYYDESGNLVTGWLQYGSNKAWYYFDGSGNMHTGWLQYGSNKAWYYFNAGGDMATGWKQIDGKWYYFNAGGDMATGWKQLSGKWYYFTGSGDMVTGWKQLSGKWYYFTGSGDMVTGWKQLSGKWYYFTSSGDMVTGWKQISGKWYYFTGGGDMVTGWKQIGGTWYYFTGSGDMVTGWKQLSGKWYYFESSGAMLVGTSKTIGGKTYYFNASGVCTNP